MNTDRYEIYRHKKSGKNYLFLFDVTVESTGKPAIVYKSCETGQRFIRPSEEFYDGRFELVEIGGDNNK